MALGMAEQFEHCALEGYEFVSAFWINLHASTRIKARYSSLSLGGIASSIQSHLRRPVFATASATQRFLFSYCCQFAERKRGAGRDFMNFSTVRTDNSVSISSRLHMVRNTTSKCSFTHF